MKRNILLSLFGLVVTTVSLFPSAGEVFAKTKPIYSNTATYTQYHNFASFKIKKGQRYTVTSNCKYNAKKHYQNLKLEKYTKGKWVWANSWSQYCKKGSVHAVMYDTSGDGGWYRVVSKEPKPPVKTTMNIVVKETKLK